MKKIVLAAFNARYTHSCLAAYCLRNVARDAGWDPIIMEFSARGSAASAAARIVAERPDAVAFPTYIWNATQVAAAIAAVREALPGCMIVLGGPEAGYSAEQWLATVPAIDRIVAGPGEAGFRLVLEGAYPPRGDAEKIVRVQNPHFSSIPFPYEDADFAGLANRFVYYESSRGCAFRCSYCLSSRDDQRPQFRDAAAVRDELRRVMRHAPGTVKFVDRSFNLDPARGREIWKGIMEDFRGAGTTFHFEVFPALLGDEDFALLERAPRGLFQFEIGVQSLNAESLAAVRRNHEWESIGPRIARLVSLGTVHTHVDLVLGLPHETMESAARGIDALYRLGADHFQAGFLKVLPGTEIAGRAGELGIEHDPDPPYAVQRTRTLSGDDIARLRGIARVIDLFYNESPFASAMAEILSLHDGPFTMLSDLSAAFGDLPLSRDRASLAAALLNWVDRKFPSRRDFLLDCLRWDWARASRGAYLPAALRYPGGPLPRKRAAAAFARGAFGDMSRDEFDAAALFVPMTGEFRAARLEGRGAAMILPGGRAVLFDMERMLPYMGKKKHDLFRDIAKPYRESGLEPACPHFRSCGGCLLQDVPYERQLDLKREYLNRVLDGVAAIETVHGSPPYRYRNRMDLVCAFGRMGLRRAGSFRSVVGLERCPLMQEKSERAMQLLAGLLEGIEFYDYLRHEGYLRYVVLRQAMFTGNLMVNFVVSRPENLLGGAVDAAAGIADSVSLLVNGGKADVSFGPVFETVRGGYIEESFDGIRYRITPNSFFQSNSATAIRAYRAMRAAARGRVLELYSGVGSISLYLAPAAEHVTGVEIVEEAVAAARLNRELNGAGNAEFVCADAAAYMAAARGKFDTLVLDPPRAGLAPSMRPLVDAGEFGSILYLSCNPLSFGEDVAALGRWRIESVEAYDMFPQTPHVEILARLVPR